MKTKDNFIWLKLLWSIVLLVAITLLLYFRSSKVPTTIFAFGMHAYVFSPYILVVTCLAILSRIINPKGLRHSFLYIFIGALNTDIGATGLCLNVNSPAPDCHLYNFLFIGNILSAFFIFLDMSLK